MLLSARLLDDVCEVNAYKYVPEIEVTARDSFDIYIQLIDKSQNVARLGFNPSGLRHMPLAGATLTATVVNVNPAVAFSRVATQPFPRDTSIWRLSFLTTDPISAGTVTLSFALTEGAVVRRFTLLAALRVSGSLEAC